ncbi:MAG: ClpXP protease specificity-enhancing factor [Halothiobacillaceae bacterium]|nr:ClpXP protease specificity-enhancing factor [Halothiobacillaceae bacterium]
MLSKRPYLVPAFYDWIVDQGHVPHLVVNADAEGVVVPAAFVEEGHIQLNVGPNAVRNFHMDRVGVSFEARFGGHPEQIFVPMHAIRAIVDRDSGQGATFADETDETFPDGSEVGHSSSSETGEDRKGRPRLRAVRGGEDRDAADVNRSRKEDREDGDGPDDDPPPSGGGGGKGGPSLRVVK